MIARRHVVEKVVTLMDQIGEMQNEFARSAGQSERTQIHESILRKALVVDHLMWVLELGDPNLPGAALVREEWAAIQASEKLADDE